MNFCLVDQIPAPQTLRHLAFKIVFHIALLGPFRGEGAPCPSLHPGAVRSTSGQTILLLPILPPDLDPDRRRWEAEAPILLLENPAQVIADDRLLLRRRYAALVAEMLHRLLHAGESLGVLEPEGADVGADSHLAEDVVEDVGLGAWAGSPRRGASARGPGSPDPSGSLLRSGGGRWCRPGRRPRSDGWNERC
jgi:hypothetical protein